MKYLFAFVYGLLIFVAPALAQQVAGDGQVVIPWGDLLASSASTLVTLAGAVLAFALARLPASILAMVKTWQVDQLLEKSLSYGINMTATAAKGQALTVPVANKVLESALEYAIANGSSALVSWMGGKDMIEKKLIARLNLVPEAGDPVR